MSHLPYLESVGLSDIGERSNNEDRWLSLSHFHFFAIADGMGGHNAGEIAAQTVITHLFQWKQELIQIPAYHSMGTEKYISLLRTSIKDANVRVFDLGQENQEMQGMGTTLSCLSFLGTQVICAHIGDSRIYCQRGPSFKQLTEDDSFANKLFHTKEMQTDQKLPSPYKNMITKAIGASFSIEPTIKTTTWQKNDLFLLCTDGLSDFVDDRIISLTIQQKISLKQRAENLIQIAKKNGSRDNITILLIAVHDEDDHSHLSR
jgi:serine/threonine protein phosphatase PrpC